MVMLLIVNAAVPVLVSVTGLAALDEPTVWSAKVRLLGENVIAAAVPVPLSGMVWGLVLALSVMVMLPEILPVVVGVKVTLMVQLPPAAPPVPQLLVWEKLAEAAILAIVSFPPVLLVSLTTLTALLVFTAWLPKLRLVGASRTVGVVPVPVVVTVWGLLEALSVTTTVPESVPVFVGVKTTLMVQFPAAATEDPQVLVCE
jgi:hypothetical protein